MHGKKDMDRIRRMERTFDQVCAALERGEDCCAVTEEIRALAAYMDGGQWMEDYAADERGEWPEALKRGVLSQDALYNLLTEIQERGE